MVVPVNVSNSEKITYAAKHKIPVVSDAWLYSSMTHSQKMSLSDYVVTGRPTKNLDRADADRSSPREGSVSLPQDKR